jgi:Holliday junction resolvase RusA-like endonuclease
MRLVIPVEPTAKGRPRVVRGKNGHSVTYTPDKTVNAEERIRWHLREHGVRPFAEKVALTVSLTFWVQKPKTAKKTAQPVTRPDLDQYVKLVLDACNGFLWHDDSQVVEIIARKDYGEPSIVLDVREDDPFWGDE